MAEDTKRVWPTPTKEKVSTDYRVIRGPQGPQGPPGTGWITPAGCYKVTNIYVNQQGKLVIEYDDVLI